MVDKCAGCFFECLSADLQVLEKNNKKNFAEFHDLLSQAYAAGVQKFGTNIQQHLENAAKVAMAKD